MCVNQDDFLTICNSRSAICRSCSTLFQHQIDINYWRQPQYSGFNDAYMYSFHLLGHFEINFIIKLNVHCTSVCLCNTIWRHSSISYRRQLIWRNMDSTAADHVLLLLEAFTCSNNGWAKIFIPFWYTSYPLLCFRKQRQWHKTLRS